MSAQKQPPESRPVLNADLSVQMHKALAHPLRVQMLHLLSTEKVSSATTMSHVLNEKLGNVAYHLKTLKTQPGILEFVTKRKVRGGEEMSYRLPPNSLASKINWPQIPAPFRQGLRGTAFAEFVELATAALQSEVVERGKGSTFNSCSLRLDGQGWDEVRAAMVEAQEKVDRAEENSCKRLGKRSKPGEVRAIVGMYVFEPLGTRDCAE